MSQPLATERPLLELKGICKAYGSSCFHKTQTILKDVNCIFYRGQITAILGHNGAGKTSSLRIILGLSKADRGDVYFKGHPLSQELKAYIGYMPELNKLPARLSVEELYVYFSKLYKPWRPDLGELKVLVQRQLEDLNLGQLRKKFIGQLSKGQGRRVAWGLATLHKPDLLILDEPLSGLDPPARQELIQRLQQFAAAGKSVILTSHDLSNLASYCHNIFILKEGSLVFNGQECAPVDWREESLIKFFT